MPHASVPDDPGPGPPATGSAFRVLLVHMPFADIKRPAIGLSLLKAGLARAGVECDVLYLNLLFAQLIGRESYAGIDRFNPEPQLGEWLFAEALFPGALPELSEYYAEVLRPALAEPFDEDGAAFARAVQEPELLAGLVTLRRQALEFVEEALVTHPWQRYALVGFSTTFQQNLAALALARRVKEAHPRVLVAFGGANCEGDMGLALLRLFPFVDVVCSGEGDDAFTAFAAGLRDGRRRVDVDGLLQRVDSVTIVPSAMTSPVRELDALPIPDYSEFVAQRERLSMDAQEVTLPVESSRGCWWGERSHCTFCGLNGSTMFFRTKSPDRFLRELDELVERYGVRDLAATDNIMDMRYFDSVLPRLAEKRPGLTLFYETKANLQRHHLRRFREAGVTHIQPGIESLSSPILRLMRKGVYAYQNIRLLRLCGEFLVWPSWNLLAGFPGEDPAEYERQADLVPLLTHLTPPRTVSFLRLDRFSPLFQAPDRAGLRHVRASEAYRYLYPFGDDDLQHLAYFFEFDYADGRDPRGYLKRLQGEVSSWRQRGAHDSLMYLDDGDALTVVDRRHGEPGERHVLRGAERLVYLECEPGATRASVVRALERARPAEAPTDVDAVLDGLVRSRLVVSLDGRYLALAIGGHYHIEVLAAHLRRGAPVPSDVQAAVRRLFELHPDGLGPHLARALS